MPEKIEILNLIRNRSKKYVKQKIIKLWPYFAYICGSLDIRGERGQLNHFSQFWL